MLNELYKQLELIKKIECLCENPEIIDVQQLQTHFKEGLWIFHPRFEGTARFTSNQEINSIIGDLFDIKDYESENSKKQPNFVVLDDSTISTYTSYYYIDDSEVIGGYDDVLIIELKRSGLEIKSKDKYHALDYAKEIKRQIPHIKHITVYILGNNVDTKRLII